MFHHESTNEERESESSPMELYDIVTAVSIEDSSKEYILDELRRLIQNKTAKNTFYSGALLGLVTSVLSFLIAQRVALCESSGMRALWATVTFLTLLFIERTLILNIFRASYERKSIGNDSITHTVVSFVDFKIITGMGVGAYLTCTGMIMGVCLTNPWVLSHLSRRLLSWLVPVVQIFYIGRLVINNSITDNSIMKGDVHSILGLLNELWPRSTVTMVDSSNPLNLASSV